MVDYPLSKGSSNNTVDRYLSEHGFAINWTLQDMFMSNVHIDARGHTSIKEDSLCHLVITAHVHRSHSLSAAVCRAV